jgi:hypothetical protein
MLGGPVAMAQSSSKSGSGTGASQNMGGTPSAPVGHRQPRAGDLPSGEKTGNTKLDEENAMLDRKIKSICRGC